MREIRGKRQSLTSAQRQVLGGLAAGYSVSWSSGPTYWQRGAEVKIGNGTRLMRITVESLLDRELIEEAGREIPRQYYKIVFYRLTETGRNEVIRQSLHFEPEVVEMPLPEKVFEILQEVERYRAQFGKEPRVEIHGTVAWAVGRLMGSPFQLEGWKSVAAFDEERNILGLGEPGEEVEKLVWIKLLEPMYSYSIGRGKFRLCPS